MEKSKTYQGLFVPKHLDICGVNPIIFCVVYVPPNPHDAYYDSLFDYITGIANMSDTIILIGDFNFPDVNWATLSGSYIFNIK